MTTKRLCKFLHFFAGVPCGGQMLKYYGNHIWLSWVVVVTRHFLCWSNSVRIKLFSSRSGSSLKPLFEYFKCAALTPFTEAGKWFRGNPAFTSKEHLEVCLGVKWSRYYLPIYVFMYFITFLDLRVLRACSCSCSVLAVGGAVCCLQSTQGHSNLTCPTVQQMCFNGSLCILNMGTHLTSLGGLKMIHFTLYKYWKCFAWLSVIIFNCGNRLTLTLQIYFVQ